MHIDTPAKLDSLINARVLWSRDISFSPEFQQLNNLFREATRIQNSGNAVDAESAYRRILHRWPSFVAARYQLAGILRRGGRVNEAMQEAQIALRYADADPDVFTQVGILYGELGDVFRELEMYQRAVNADPFATRALFYLVLTYRQQGLLSVARGWLEIADTQIRPFINSPMRVQETSFLLEWHWGMLYECLGNWEAAVSHFEAARMISANEEVEHKLVLARQKLAEQR